MNNANIFREFYVLSEKWCEMVRKIRQRLATIIFGVVNNYRQLATFFFFLRSTISNNWQQLFWSGQQLSTIIWGWSSIILNSVAHGVRSDYRSNRDYRSEKIVDNC